MPKADVMSDQFIEPWNLTFEERIRKCYDSDISIAYYYEEPNNSTFRYRAYNMAQVINEFGAGRVKASYFFKKDLAYINEISDATDILVICRTRYDSSLSRLVEKYKIKNKTVYFDVDDLVFDTKYNHLILSSLNSDLGSEKVWDDWFAYTSRMGAALKCADKTISTNEYLADKIREFSGLECGVIPNFMNKEQIDISEKLYCNRNKSKSRNLELPRIGYFSGSPSHKKDFDVVAPALESLMLKNSQINLVLVGYIEPNSNLAKFKHRIQIRKFTDYVNLQKYIANVDINLMPLQSNVFTNCKSELKYFEAAAVGTVSIASPTATYSNAIKNGENGYISQDYDWENIIESCLINEDEYDKIKKKAYEDVSIKYSWRRQFENIEKVLGI